MTMEDVITLITTNLRSVLSCTVEEYWRTEPPKALIAYVQPSDRGPEKSNFTGNDFSRDYFIDIYIEVPWDNKVMTARALGAELELIANYVSNNRQLLPDYVMTLGETKYMYVQRSEAGKPCWAAKQVIKIEYPEVR